MKEQPKRFEKADDNTLRLILERVENVPMATLISNKKQLEEKIAEFQRVLDNVNEMLEEATKLGIVPKKEEKK